MPDERTDLPLAPCPRRRSISVRLSVEVLNHIQGLAKRHHMTRDQAITLALAAADHEALTRGFDILPTLGERGERIIT